MPNWLLELGYIGTRGNNLLQFINQNQALDIDAIGGFQRRAGNFGQITRTRGGPRVVQLGVKFRF